MFPAREFRFEKLIRFRQAQRVNDIRLFSLLLAATLLAGCDRSSAPAPEAADALGDQGPQHAQPKLPTLNLYLGAETLAAELALTQQQEMTGMMFRTNILETDAMLFVLPQPQRASFWMKNCPESISAAYIGTDGTILEIHHLEQNDTNAVVAASEEVRFVLETKEGWFGRHNIAPGTVVRTERGSLPETFLRGR